MVSFPPVSPPRPYTPPPTSPIRATCPTHLILLDFITRTILGEKYKSFSSSLCNLLHSPVTSSLLRPNILLNTMFSNSFPPAISTTKFHTHTKQKAKSYVYVYIYISIYIEKFLLTYTPSIYKSQYRNYTQKAYNIIIHFPRLYKICIVLLSQIVALYVYIYIYI